MNWTRFIAGCLLLCVTLGAPSSVRACPLCAEAIANSNDAEDDKDNFPAAMNQSIYLMLGVPYLALIVFGVMIYRGMRKNEAYTLALQQAGSDNSSPA